MSTHEHVPQPSRTFRDRDTGKWVLAMFLPDSMEYVTIPTGKFWANLFTNSVTGLWNKQMFLTRFEPV